MFPAMTTNVPSFPVTRSMTRAQRQAPYEEPEAGNKAATIPAGPRVVEVEDV